LTTYFAAYAATASWGQLARPVTPDGPHVDGRPHRIQVSDLPSAASSRHCHHRRFPDPPDRSLQHLHRELRRWESNRLDVTSSAGGAASRRMMAWKWIASRRWYSPTLTIRGWTRPSCFRWLIPITDASSLER
jgi:hypothetical protein